MRTHRATLPYVADVRHRVRVRVVPGAVSFDAGPERRRLGWHRQRTPRIGPGRGDTLSNAPGGLSFAPCCPSNGVAIRRDGYDVVVIGAGLVGGAIAYGLARAGLRVAVLDEEDATYRASRGNFGLVWVQGKGVGRPEYALWSRASSERWFELSEALAGDGGPASCHVRPGGVIPALSDDELSNLDSMLAGLRRAAGKAFTRCGMGPCQGRMCATAVSEMFAERRHAGVGAIGHYGIRPPVKPLTLGELAALEGTGTTPADRASTPIRPKGSPS